MSINIEKAVSELAQKCAEEIFDGDRFLPNHLIPIIKHYLLQLAAQWAKDKAELEANQFMCESHKWPYGVNPDGTVGPPICPWCERNMVEQLTKERDQLAAELAKVKGERELLRSEAEKAYTIIGHGRLLSSDMAQEFADKMVKAALASGEKGT